ncbi:hypothetical protein BsWGS_00191 [Bradybaena similaris]
MAEWPCILRPTSISSIVPINTHTFMKQLTAVVASAASRAHPPVHVCLKGGQSAMEINSKWPTSAETCKLTTQSTAESTVVESSWIQLV